MTRKELYTELLSKGFYNLSARDRSENQVWKDAIKQYKIESGDHDANLLCGSCVNKIKRWLEK